MPRPTDDQSPRCLAMTRSGKPFQTPKVQSRKRCRMHGGAKGNGAPKGNRNAWKHGRYSVEVAERRRFTQLSPTAYPNGTAVRGS